MTDAGAGLAGRVARAGAVLALVVTTLFVYAPVRGHDFLNYDDDTYITDNPQVQAGLSGAGVVWAFTTGHAGNWHPLTWLSLMLDRELFGPGPAGVHLINLLLHLVNTLLLLLVVRRLTGAFWPSAFVAALFALHPLHVESVAWAAERKDVLSGLFALLTLWAYAAYVARPGAARYCLVAALLALGLTAKPMLVTLPLVMLLLDRWPLGRAHRWATLVREKLPLLALAGASSVVTLLVQQRGGAVATLDTLPLAARLANAAVGYARYLLLTVWPARLGIFYPLPPDGPSALAVGGALLLLTGITVAAARAWRRGPYLLTGWLWFVVTLLPVIGVVQVGEQAIADRYTYLPLVGLFMAGAWGVAEAAARRRPGVLVAAACVTVVACAARSAVQVTYWRDSETLFRRTAAVTEPNWVAQLNLGMALVTKGRTGEALPHYQEAIRLRPEKAKPHNNLGMAFGQLGRLDEARLHLQASIRLDPALAEAHNNLGVVQAMQGRAAEAEGSFERALAIEPGLASAHFNLGLVLARRGRLDTALAHLGAAVRLKPDHAAARAALARYQVAAPPADTEPPRR